MQAYITNQQTWVLSVYDTCPPGEARVGLSIRTW